METRVLASPNKTVALVKPERTPAKWSSGDSNLSGTSGPFFHAVETAVPPAAMLRRRPIMPRRGLQESCIVLQEVQIASSTMADARSFFVVAAEDGRVSPAVSLGMVERFFGMMVEYARVVR